MHRPERPESRRALAWVLVITLGFAAVEVAGGLLSGALVLLADAAHMLTDAAAVGLSLFAAWIARRPATLNKTYGYYRLEILAALVNGALLIALTVAIVLEALRRLQAPEAIRPGILLGVATAGLLANLAGVAVLHRAKGESLNIRGAYLHVLSDLLGSVAAIGAGIIVALTGWLPADPLLSIVLALLILVSAARLVWEAVDVLLEATPAHVDLAALAEAIAGVPGVTGVHDLHVWTVSSGMVAMSGHATVPGAVPHQSVLDEICRRVRTFGIQHVTVQVEGEECGMGDGVGLRPAGPRDLESVRALLRAADLPLDGVEEQFGPRYVVAEVGGELAGAAGVEVYGGDGLLRSVVVAPSHRGTGLGKALVADRLAWARREGLAAVYLLTTTAPGFFASLGFERVARTDAPAGIRGSREFASVCPGSSVMMRLAL